MPCTASSYNAMRSCRVQAYAIRPPAGEGVATSLRGCCRERDPHDKKKAGRREDLSQRSSPQLSSQALPPVCPAREPHPSQEQSRDSHCRHHPHQEYAEDVILFPHNMRLRRGYWAKYIVPIIHINGNSMVATCHLLD